MRNCLAKNLAGFLLYVVAQAVPASMSTSGQFAVNESGAATYSIPIQVPPGIAGMEPKLALSYNSQAGNGLMGMGWGLSGLSTITRCPRSIAQDGVKGGIYYDGNDRYCMDGQRLMLVGGVSYGANEAEYRTELDGFSKVISYGAAGTGPAWFKVWTKAGLILEYGNTADSRIEANRATSNVRVWAVNKISDTKGNFISFTYTEDPYTGTYAPTRVDYTGTAGTSGPNQAPTASVRFVYELHPDWFVPLYFAGGEVMNALRLTTVQTYVGNTLSKEYRATYGASPSSGHSRLATLHECAMPGDVCKPALTFSWTEFGGNTFATATTLLSGDSSLFLDLNGDGRADSLRFGADGLYVGLATSTGMNTPNRWINAFGTGQGYADQTVTPILIQDVNGDGYPDAVGFASDGVYVAKSNGGSAFNAATRWVTAFGSGATAGNWTNQTTHPRMLADVNGDGFADIVGFKDDGVYVSLNTGASFASPTLWLASFGTATSPAYASSTNYPRYALDMNGDGRADLIGFSPYGVYVALSNGTGFDGATPWLTNSVWAGESQDATQRTLADINGDGLPDIVVFRNDVISFTLNIGTRFKPGVTTVSPAGWSGYTTQSATPRYAVDVNGDGKADLVGFSPTGVQVALSTGSGFSPTTPWLADFGGQHGYANGSLRQLADVDGDGFPDIVGVKNGLTYAAKSGIRVAPDLAMNFNNGLANVATVNYQPLTKSGVYTKGAGSTYPTVDLQIPLYVAAQVDSSNGLGGSVATHYQYGELRVDIKGRGPLGFGWVQSTQAQTGITTRTDYRQDWPYVGMPRVVMTTTPEGGMLKRSSLFYSCTDFDAVAGCDVAAGKRYFPYSGYAYEMNSDLNGAALPMTTTQTTYDCQASPTDCYGNVTQMTVSTGDGYSKTTTNIYNNDASNWYLGRLLRSTVTSTTP